MTLDDANRLLQAHINNATICHINDGRGAHSNPICRVVIGQRVYDYRGSYEDVLVKLGAIKEEDCQYYKDIKLREELQKSKPNIFLNALTSNTDEA